MDIRQYLLTHKTGLSHHHEHLGGCVPHHILWEIAKTRGINPGGINDFPAFSSIFGGSIDDHDTYVNKNVKGNKFAITHAVQSSPDAIKQSIYNAASLAYRESNVTKLEIRFNPMFRNDNKFYDLDVIILAANTGAVLAEQSYPMKVGIIIETDRSFPDESSRILASKCHKYKSSNICGFDVSGGSAAAINFTEKMGGVYKYLHENNVNTTAHLGETGDVDEILSIVTKDGDCYLDRIGHGIYAYDNNKALSIIRKHDICLEICPTSNVTLNVVDGDEHMHEIIRKLIIDRIPFSINTDATEFMGVTIVDEICNLYDSNVITHDDVDTILTNSMKYSFL